MKIYHIYSKIRSLQPTKGDFINEWYIDKMLSTFSNVYYNGSLNDAYDISLIRANKTIFDKLKNKSKIRCWMASPYNLECFENSNYIYTYTKAWENKLRNGEYITGLNPKGKKFNNIFTIYQPIGNHFIPLQDNSKTIDIKKNINKYPIIGCFGRMVETNYPYLLEYTWKDILKKYPNALILCGTPSSSINKLLNIKEIKYISISHDEVPYYISACDICLVSGYGEEWEIAGCRKLKEVAGCGVPLITSISNARVEELGNYEFFLDRNYFDKNICNNRKEILINNIDRLLSDKELYNKTSSYLVERMKKYRIKRCTEILKNILERLDQCQK